MFGGLFQKDPTKNFPLVGRFPLEWDSSRGALNGVPLGASVHECGVFGPATRFTGKLKEFSSLDYAQSGLTIFLDKGIVDTFIFIVNVADDYSEISFTGCEPVLKKEGLKISKTTSEVELENLFGKPDIRNEDEEEICVYYSKDGYCFEFDLFPDGKVSCLSIYVDD